MTNCPVYRLISHSKRQNDKTSVRHQARHEAGFPEWATRARYSA